VFRENTNLSQKRYLVKTLIYPVPIQLSSLQVVRFRMIVSVHAGPNAVLSFKREGYKKTDFDIRDFTEVMTYRFLETGSKHRCRNQGYSPFSKAAFVHSLQS